MADFINLWLLGITIVVTGLQPRVCLWSCSLLFPINLGLQDWSAVSLRSSLNSSTEIIVCKCCQPSESVSFSLDFTAWILPPDRVTGLCVDSPREYHFTQAVAWKDARTYKNLPLSDAADLSVIVRETWFWQWGRALFFWMISYIAVKPTEN